MSGVDCRKLDRTEVGILPSITSRPSLVSWFEMPGIVMCSIFFAQCSTIVVQRTISIQRNVMAAYSMQKAAIDYVLPNSAMGGSRVLVPWPGAL